MSGPVLPPLPRKMCWKSVEGLLVVGHLADEGVGVEPEELALLVVVLAALPVGPGGVAAAEDAGGDGGVFGGAPLAAGLVVELGGGEGEHVAVLRLGLEAGAGGEDVAQVLGHAFVDPEQRALLHLGEVGLVEVEGAAVLAVPGVGELVGEEVGLGELVGWRRRSLSRRRRCRRTGRARGLRRRRRRRG